MNSVLLAMILVANDDLQSIDAQVTKHHTEAVERLRKWVAFLYALARQLTFLNCALEPTSCH